MQADDLSSKSINLVKMQDFPFCAETNRLFLTDHFFTPRDELYIRNHNVVPTIDEDFDEEFELNMGIKMTGGGFEGRKFKTWTLKELRNFNN